ncbi:MAG: sensor histidine kinase KdpD [Rickettsiales bacterium]
MTEKMSTNDFIELLESTKKGRLKIYIGSVAGVGKTYRMLEEAHSLKKKNIDVVLGYIETHGRVETEELVAGLERVPCMKIDYHGVVVEEMDLDAIINRKPEVVIVDELAHTNLPTCRNEKRYLDVIELLLSGINVICAFNIQHLESLHNLVHSITGVKVIETVPDSFINNADQIVNIDLAAEDLIDRLKSGKIYAENKVDKALFNFFKFENLTQLRELALREVAERIENPLTVTRGDVGEAKRSASDRIMVCFEPKPFSQKFLLRKASRLAGKLNTDWYVVYVETQKDRPEVIDSMKQRFLYSDMQLAEELGANFIQIRGEDRIKTWLEYAKSSRIKHFVIVNEDFSLFTRVFKTSLLRRILDQRVYDVHVVNKDGDLGGAK